MTPKEIELFVKLESEKTYSRALRSEMKKLTKKIFNLEYPQMGIRQPVRPILKIVKK